MDEFGHVKLGGIARRLATVIENNTGQESHVGHLLRGPVVQYLSQHAFIGVDQTGHAHALFVAGGNEPAKFVQFFQFAAPFSHSHTP